MDGGATERDRRWRWALEAAVSFGRTNCRSVGCSFPHLPLRSTADLGGSVSDGVGALLAMLLLLLLPSTQA